jgi:hypothetical protein
MRRNSKQRGTTGWQCAFLWPNLPAEFPQIARNAVGTGFETDFCASAADVSD